MQPKLMQAMDDLGVTFPLRRHRWPNSAQAAGQTSAQDYNSAAIVESSQKLNAAMALSGARWATSRPLQQKQAQSAQVEGQAQSLPDQGQQASDGLSRAADANVHNDVGVSTDSAVTGSPVHSPASPDQPIDGRQDALALSHRAALISLSQVFLTPCSW